MGKTRSKKMVAKGSGISFRMSGEQMMNLIKIYDGHKPKDVTRLLSLEEFE